MLSNLTRNFGFGGNRGNTRPTSGMISGSMPQRPHTPQGQSVSDPPPPYSQDSISQGSDSGAGQAVTAPHHMRENLLSAIRKTRPHNSSEIFSRGETNTVSETKSYCDEKPAHDLAFVAELKHGIQMFLPQDPSHPINATSFLQQNMVGLLRFADILKSVGEVFSVSPKILNIFFETSGKTIAFNRNGSIFCNYLYFKQLHETQILGGEAMTGNGLEDALVYWWVILCHELAHNLVADHSSNHSYYTEGFVAQYFSKMVSKAAEMKKMASRALPVTGGDEAGRLVDVE